MRFVPVCSVEADVVFHYPFEEAHTGTHKTVFKPKTCMFIHTDAQQHVPPFPAGGQRVGPTRLSRAPASRAKLTQ